MRLGTPIKIAAGLGALVVVAVIAVVVVLMTIDVNQYKPEIVAEVEKATGRQLTIDGDLGLSIGLSPAIGVDGVTFANADWGSRPEMVKVGHFAAEVDLFSLLGGGITVNRLVLEDADILLETKADGSGNWAMGPAEAAPAETEAAPADSGEGGMSGLPAIRAVTIKNARLTYIDGTGGPGTELLIESLDAEADGLSGPLAVDLKAVFNQLPVTVVGDLPSVQALRSGGPLPMDVTIETAGATLKVSGSIADALQQKGIDLAIALSGEQIARLAELPQAAGMAVPVPALGPYDIKLAAKGDLPNLSIMGLDVELGEDGALFITAKGDVKNPMGPSGINVALAVKAEDLSALEQMGGDLSAVPPFEMAATVKDQGPAWALSDIVFKGAGSDLAGTALVDVSGARPKAEVDLTSEVLDLATLMPPAEDGAAAEPAARKDKVFPSDPLPFDLLKMADAKVKLAAGQLILPNKMPIHDLSVDLALDNGRLAIAPAEATLGDGRLTSNVVLDASSGSNAGLAVDVIGKQINAGKLVQAMSGEKLLTEGLTDVTVKLKGGGASVAALMGSLNGNLLIDTGEGRVHNRLLNWAGADVFNQLAEELNPFTEKREYTPMMCTVVNFKVTDGVAVTDQGIAFETDKMTVVSSGKINLGTEQLDMAVRPKAKSGTGIGAGKLAEMVRLNGTLANPGVGLDVAGAAKTAASVGAAVATGGISLLAQGLMERSSADPDPCATAKGVASTRPAAESDNSASGSPTDAVGDAASGAGKAAEDALKGVEEGLGGLFGN
ncbi:AsmA family protein [Roseospirillum parvum]|uniref:AsmA domain-containing protein n=1 Tax=Roseospirillum parvum TaxID=83401 RepID=A0A1G7Z9X5_9PROT|nr:AsmA family protein [Roseospirillum parvum]SDH05407.1 hypothetical protein SAMN05421742_10445 [Roseospirillum parvum]